MPSRVALVSCAEARQLDADLAPIVSALNALQIDAAIVDWDNATVDWSQFAVAIVRSAWDYHSRLPEYFDWIDRASLQTRVLNSPEVLKWNCDKRYLLEASAAGVPIIPTVFVTTPAELATLADSEEIDLDGDIVVKPAVSAGANNTERFTGDAVSAWQFADELLGAGLCVMVQPYQTSIDAHGEIGLVYIGGEFSHAFRKGAILGDVALEANDLFVEEVIDPAVATTEHARVGEQVMDFLRTKFGESPLYVRVDTVRDDSGAVVIMEIEANEPSLFFVTDSMAAERFARAVRQVVSVS